MVAFFFIYSKFEANQKVSLVSQFASRVLYMESSNFYELQQQLLATFSSLAAAQSTTAPSPIHQWNPSLPLYICISIFFLLKPHKISCYIISLFFQVMILIKSYTQEDLLSISFCQARLFGEMQTIYDHVLGHSSTQY